MNPEGQYHTVPTVHDRGTWLLADLSPCPNDLPSWDRIDDVSILTVTNQVWGRGWVRVVNTFGVMVMVTVNTTQNLNPDPRP